MGTPYTHIHIGTHVQTYKCRCLKCCVMPVLEGMWLKWEEICYFKNVFALFQSPKAKRQKRILKKRIYRQLKEERSNFFFLNKKTMMLGDFSSPCNVLKVIRKWLSVLWILWKGIHKESERSHLERIDGCFPFQTSRIFTRLRETKGSKNSGLIQKQRVLFCRLGEVSRRTGWTA